MTSTQTENNHYLQQVLNFTPADLAVNQTGRMTELQLSHIHAAYHGQQQRVAFLAVLVVVITVVVLGIIFSQRAQLSVLLETAKSDQGWMLLIPLGAVIAWGGMVALTLLFRPRVKADTPVGIAQGPVRVRPVYATRWSATGQVMTELDQTFATHHLTIGRDRFYVPDMVARGFVPGAMYRAYFVRVTRGRLGLVLIAAERL